MDDFYDTDIGVQTSDILVLPSAFLGTLWSELQNIGAEKARSIMFNCGHSVGSSLSVNYVEMGTEDLDMILNQAWAEAGLGHLFVIDRLLPTECPQLNIMLLAFSAPIFCSSDHKVPRNALGRTSISDVWTPMSVS